MPSVALLPGAALVAGAAIALGFELTGPPAWWLCAPAAVGWIAWWSGAPTAARSRRDVQGPSAAHVAIVACAAVGPALVAAALLTGFFLAGVVLAGSARERAILTPLRAMLDREIGGFAMTTTAVPNRHDPLPVRAVLTSDAAPRDGFTTAAARVTAVRLGHRWVTTDGAVTFTIGGRAPPEQRREWRAGRTIEGFATFRRPGRYLNDGAPNFERDLALDGTTLFGSIKSALLVDTRGRGTWLQETAADIRQHTRDSVERRVGRHDPVAGAIVTAILIGDRTSLPDDVRLRLQAAGTYHVIAISGGNIAILAGVTLGVLLVCGITGRSAAAVAIAVLVAYAGVVTAEPSVWRATLMAVLYLGARLLGHRSPPWQAIAVAAVLLVALRPLDVRDAGFILTFGATAALMESARRAARSKPLNTVLGWLTASLAASAAVEIALLPVSAYTFSRVTSAGLLLNLAAVPLMSVVQVGGMAAVLLDRFDPVADFAGGVAYIAADALVFTSRLLDVAPWLAARVPPPALALVASYYGALALVLVGRPRIRAGGLVVLVLSAGAIVSGQPEGWLRTAQPQPGMRLTMFDVGQGESILLEFPDRAALLVDAGGPPFGAGGFDVGGRVLAPALWARGLRRIETMLLTHGDPDHIGGARAILDDFSPSYVWEGVPVPAHLELRELLHRAGSGGADIQHRRLGEDLAIGTARLRVLHPPEPDWERQRVRNDDSVVLEVLYGDVAVLMLGDVGAAVERALIPRLTPAARRILKVAHHGSRTSTSRELVERWRPHIALISCGRGNTFGHPAPEVLSRLEGAGATIYRTDLDGQITLETDGRMVAVRTYMPRRGRSK